MNILFIIACCLIPFENFIFAPSSGWATLSPIIFYIYILFNYKLALNIICKNIYLCIIFIYGILITLINYYFIEINIANLINTFISLGLGISFYIAINIYFIEKNENLKLIINKICISYTVSIIVGMIQFIAIKLQNNNLINLISLIEKRSYILNNRVQFTFTEPSFIGMHLFGILLPLYFLSKEKKIKNIIIIYIIIALISENSVRLVVDIIVFFVLYIGFKYKIKKMKNIFIVFGLFAILIPTFINVANHNYRIQQIMTYGVYADGSFSSRWFRINASIKGYYKNPINTMFGYGYGNAIIPLRNGIPEAKLEYKNSYMHEVDELSDLNFSSDSVTYSMYFRIISELGIIGFVLITLYICSYYKKNLPFEIKIYFFMVLYLYIQFDSYAFYSIWILITLLKYYNYKQNLEKG